MKALLISFFALLPPGCTAMIGLGLPQSPDMVVAADGSGTHRTVQQAFDALPDGGDTWSVIQVQPGRYREKLVLRPEKRKVILRSAEPGMAVLTYDDHAGRIVGGDTINTYTSASCSLEGDDIIVEGITFENSAGRVGQAVALQVTGDRVALRRCRILGDQDTFFARTTGRIYLQECEVEGTTDFIFGSAIVLFERCRIKSKKDSYVTAASTPEGNRFGFVFSECIMTAEEGVRQVHLGRPWRPFARSVFLKCRLEAHILPAGWHNWSKPERERTAFYAEYRCTGPGADRSGRVSWSHELADSAAADYRLEEIFGAKASAAGFATDWVPEFP